MGDITVNLYHDGIFVPNPLKYMQGECQVINDVRFEEMPIGDLFELVKRLVLNPPRRLYYRVPGTTLTRGIRELKTDDDVNDFTNVAFENGFKIDLYTEFADYDVANVDFHTEGEENVVFERLTVNDPFLNILLKGTKDDPIPPLGGKYFVEEADPDDDMIDERYKLWYYRSDSNSLLVYCGRDLDLGRCAGRRDRVRKSKKKAKDKEGNGQEENDKTTGKMPVNRESPRKVDVKVKPKVKWTRMKVGAHRGKHCPFRLWASWMSSERSFQIKTLYSDHRCARNFNMGSLVTFRWIARHYAKEIITNPSMTYQAMRESIREKFCIDVSTGQSKRAKQCALYEHAGGLIEHYGRLWEYRQAILDSNPGSTCHIDVNVNKDAKMKEIKEMDEAAYDYLMERDPPTWCKAFFRPDSQCASFENGISESFNGQILPARGKPIIAVLEDIRVYIMQRMWNMSKQAAKLNDSITPSIRKQLDQLALKQMNWQVIPKTIRGNKQEGWGSAVRGGSQNRGGGSQNKGGGSLSRGGGSQNRGGGSVCRGGRSLSRGGGSKKRGGGSQTMGGASKTRGGGSISRGKGSKNRVGGQRITILGQRKMEGKIPSTQRYYTLLCFNMFFELQYQKDLEAEKEVLEEEARKRAEYEQNGKIYLDWEDMQSDQFSENELDRPATLSELEALDEAIDEYNATLPSIDEGQPSQPEPTPPHLVQAPTEESQAPRMALERLLKSHSVSELC
ncbi:hypothetical protein CTI12_AA081420 [Artemisia annua]|uniref:PB1-like domain-containing protein n=1 Tax=Artemisia annua TaxID=35608 RepID=A0A2U1Q2K0_ARTAN|nr:hypothetical protein CTI12_AA081420 [Artemisia annua]